MGKRPWWTEKPNGDSGVADGNRPKSAIEQARRERKRWSYQREAAEQGQDPRAPTAVGVLLGRADIHPDLKDDIARRKREREAEGKPGPRVAPPGTAADPSQGEG